MVRPMTIREHMTLTIAATPYRYLGAKEADLREMTGWTPARAWQVVDALLDRGDAVVVMPAEVNRLRRLREARRRARKKSLTPTGAGGPSR